MVKYLLILFLLAACSSSRVVRTIASEDGSIIELSYDIGFCIKSENLSTYSLVPEIYQVQAYDDLYYYLFKYQPQKDQSMIFDDSVYDDPHRSWAKISQIKMTLIFAHSKMAKTACPFNL